MTGIIGTGRLMALLCALTLVASCGVPRSGPTRGEIFDGTVQQNGDSYLVPVNASVARATDFVPPLGFSPGFRGMADVAPDTIRAGDTLSLVIYENVDDGLLGAGGVPAPLSEVQVDDEGFIFVPYAGRLLAAGKTPEQLRRMVTESLGTQTPDPQILVSRTAGNGATVTVSGQVQAQGVYPIERPTRRLSAMLARAGGISIEPEIAQVTVLRGGQSGKVWFNSLFSTPGNDIALRGGDRVLVEADERYYTALGATGRQSRVRFESQRLSAVDALAQVGGLSSIAADPTGLFILRREPQEIARLVTGQPVLGAQQVVYLIDLTKGEGLFNAKAFNIRDEDTIYVTEAPVTQFNKAVSAFFGSLTTVSAVETLATRPR